jgi:hypothetical protein
MATLYFGKMIKPPAQKLWYVWVEGAPQNQQFPLKGANEAAQMKSYEKLATDMQIMPDILIDGMDYYLDIGEFSSFQVYTQLFTTTQRVYRNAVIYTVRDESLFLVDCFAEVGAALLAAV